MDVAGLGSVRAGLAAIEGSVDALVMNAGVIGPKMMDLTADGVTTEFATNVLATSSSSKDSWPMTGSARLRSSSEVKQSAVFRSCG